MSRSPPLPNIGSVWQWESGSESVATHIAPGGRFVQTNSVRFKRKSDSPLKKKASHGFQGYPVATIAFYGPDDKRASKVAVGIVYAADAEPAALERWFGRGGRRSDRSGHWSQHPPLRAGSWSQVGRHDGWSYRLPA